MPAENNSYSFDGQWAQEPTMQRPRVVVTGIGMITPSGNDVESSWQNIIAGNSAITRLDPDQMHRLAELAEIEHLENIKLNIGVAGIIDPLFDAQDYITSFNVPGHSKRSDLKRMTRAQLLSLAASAQALENAGILMEGEIADEIDKDRFGVKIGTSIGGMSFLAHVDNRMSTNRKITPISPLKVGLERVAAVPSQAFGLRAEKFTPTDACATGSQAIISGIKDILLGDSQRVLVGGVDASVEQMTLGMFDNLGALNRTDNPYRASTPFDIDRNGFVMAEGAGIIVLESEEAALKRGANILGEVAGYGAAADAHHETEPSGFAAEESLRLALLRGGLPRDGKLYINAHGTSTKVGDPVEIMAIRRTLEEKIQKESGINVDYAISSTKSMMGHTMGASGAIEAIVALLALRDQILPPTINLERVMQEGIGVDLVPNEARPARIVRSGSKNFGFGGSGTHVLFKHYQPR